MPFATVNGIEFYHEVHGEGPALVFAHGAGGNHVSWFQQVPHFSRDYRVVTFDHRTFGRSDDTNGLGRAAFVDDLRGLLDELGIERAALVAQSMGGGSCMGFAARFPERVSALVMADTIAGVTLPEPAQSQQQAHSERMRSASQLERVVSKSFPVREPERTELYLQIASFNVDNANRLAAPTQPLEAPSMEQVVAAGQQVPTLFLVGSEDALVPPEISRLASEQVPKAQFAEVADSGHSVYFEQPSVFNHVVQGFLATALKRD